MEKYQGSRKNVEGYKPKLDFHAVKFSTSCSQRSVCPHHTKECDFANSPLLYNGARKVDVVFARIPEKECSDETFTSSSGVAFKRLVDCLLAKEIKKPVGVYYTDIVRCFTEWDNSCKANFFNTIFRLKPKIVVAVGVKACAALLNRPDLNGNNYKELRGILIPPSKDRPFAILPMMDGYDIYAKPFAICAFIEDLRRALGIYQFDSMQNGFPIKELGKNGGEQGIKEIKQFVDHVLYDVQTEAIAFDTEDKNLNRVYGNALDSLQFCWNINEGAYFIWYAHPNSKFSPKELLLVKKDLQRLFMQPAQFKYWLMHNAKFDLAMLLTQLEIRPIKPVICTMTFPFILEENYTDSPFGGFGLKYLSKKYGFQGFNDNEVLNARKAGKLTDIPDASFVQYATDDVVATRQLFEIFKSMAHAQNYYKQAMQLMEGFYSRVYSFLVEMEHNGIDVDQIKLDELGGPYSPINQEMQESLEKLKESEAVQEANATLLTDITTDRPLFGSSSTWLFDIDKVKHKQTLFFHALNLPIVNTGVVEKVTVGGNTFKVGKMDKRFQDKYKDIIPEVQWLVDYQQLKKLKTSYIKSIKKFLNRENGYQDYYTDQKLRPEFSLMAKTGRARASKPNSQQIPKGNTEVRKQVRSLFCCPPGQAIISLDYMAVEIRAWGILSRDTEMIKMFKQSKSYRDNWRRTNDPTELQKAKLYGDIHTVNASVLFNVSVHDVTKTMRNAVKALTFGTIYGMGLNSMAAQMGCEIEEAKRRRTAAFSKFKQAGQWLNNIETVAISNFYVTSPLGRRRRLWELTLFDSDFIKSLDLYNPKLPKKQLEKNAEIENSLIMHCARAKRQGRNCVDYKTEILTKDGWKKYNEISVGELALSKNITTGKLEWQPIEAIHHYPDYQGDIYDIKSRSFSSICTPNHRWPIYNKSTKRDEIRETSELSIYGDHRIHRTGDYEAPLVSPWTDAEVGIIGWALTDGTYRRDPKWNLSSIHVNQTKEENKPNIDKYFAEANIEFTKHDYPSKNINNLYMETIWHFSGEFAKRIREVLPNKQLNSEFLLSLTSKQLEILRSTMMLGDGTSWRGNIKHNWNKRFWAFTEYEADMFQMLLTLLGKSCVKAFIPPSEVEIKYPSVLNIIKQTKGIWAVREHERKYVQIVKSQIKKEFRKEPIWCVTIKNSTFVARREGQTYITGNSPIQGLASDITFLSAALLLQNVILKENKPWEYFNVVHDAIYIRVPIDEIKDCITACEQVFTKDVVDLLDKEFDCQLPLPLEVEFEIGTHGGNLKKWNFSENHLDEIVNEVRQLDAEKLIELKQAQIYQPQGIESY